MANLAAGSRLGLLHRDRRVRNRDVSEVRSLSRDERRHYAKRLVEYAGDRGPVFMAVTADRQEDSIDFARDAADAGCAAVMAAPPLQEKLDEGGLYGFFRPHRRCRRNPAHRPGRFGLSRGTHPTFGLSPTPDTLRTSQDCLQAGSASQWPVHLGPPRCNEGGGPDLRRLGGIYLLDSMRRGVTGTMPGMDLVDGVVAIWRAMRRGDENSAYAIYFRCAPIVALQMQSGLDGFLAIEKYLLKKRGLFPNERRRPPIRWSLDRETAEEVDRLFARLQQAVAADAANASCQSSGKLPR